MRSKYVYHDGRRIEVTVNKTMAKDYVAFAYYRDGDGTLGVSRDSNKKHAFNTSVKNLITVTSAT